MRQEQSWQAQDDQAFDISHFQIDWGLRSWRRPPPSVSGRPKKHLTIEKNKGFKSLDNYSEWPKVAGAVIKA